MKTKFNLFERVAGLFVLGAMGGALFALVSVAYQKGWFSAKIPYYAKFESAEGLHVGTRVQIAGLKAGEVTHVHLQADNSVRIRFVVLEKFQDKIRMDSRVQMIRPFIIGEKIIDITVGSQTAKLIERETELAVNRSMDIMDLLSGRELGTYLSSMTEMTDNLRMIMTAFSDKQRFEALIETLDVINPMVKNLNTMSKDVVVLTRALNRKQRIGRLVGNLATATDELQPHFPQIAKHGPKVAKDLAVTLENLVVMSSELKKVLPAVSAVAPELPRTSKRLVEAIDEAVVMMKAVQKSWFIEGHAKEVREEEKKRRNREPANDK